MASDTSATEGEASMQAASARQPEPPPHVEHGLLPWLGRLWEAVKEIGRVLWPMRFSVFLVLVMGPFLLLPQSQDALLTLAQSKHLVRQALFAVLVLLWALTTHYWARFMSRLELRPA